VLRRSPRAIVLWLLAIAAAVGTAALVASDLAALHRHATELGDERTVVVARRPLGLGTILGAGDLSTRRVHSSQLPPGVLPEPARAVGRVVTVPVVRGGFVATANLAPRHRTGVDGVLPAGTRATRVVVTDTVRPRSGAAVDVYATFDQGLTDPSTTGGDDALVLAAAVTVLGTDAARSTQGHDAFGVTLLVSPRQARALAFAAGHGVLTLALVPPEEARTP
jgi:Flp pilus assembly protein CpaB